MEKNSRRRKPRPESKPRIVARVEPVFHEQVVKFAEALGIKIQEFVVQALVTEMQGFDLRVQLKRIENQLEAVQERKAELVKERKRLRGEVKQIASKLGVPDTPGHCVQRITEIEQELQMTADKLLVVEGDRDAEIVSKKAYEKSRDHFKMKYEESAAELRVVEAKLAAYRRQGFWGRVFGRVPEPEYFVETTEKSQLST